MLCEAETCTGCTACMNICPKDCISFVADEDGNMIPQIDKSQCIQCGNCERVCPQKQDISWNEVKHCYAAWRTDTQKREKSASGGVSTFIAEEILERSGIVYETVYDSDEGAVFRRIIEKEELENGKGSFYVQSKLAYTFRQIKKDLTTYPLVYFVGTPCQVAGLKSYLGRDYDNLLCCDLVCHGVCPQAYLYEEIQDIQKRKHITDKIDKVVFRSQIDRFNFRLSLFCNGHCVFNQRGKWNHYMYGFISGINLRKSCFGCRYTQKRRIGDISLGDYFGIDNKSSFEYPADKLSMCLVNNEKAEWFIQQLNKDIILVERDYAEPLSTSAGLQKPVQNTVLAEKWRKYYRKYGYRKACQKILDWRICLEYFKLTFIFVKRKLIKG